MTVCLCMCGHASCDCVFVCMCGHASCDCVYVYVWTCSVRVLRGFTQPNHISHANPSLIVIIFWVVHVLCYNLEEQDFPTRFYNTPGMAADWTALVTD